MATVSENQRRTCAAKVRYRSELEAVLAAKLLGRTNPTWRPLRPYPCPVCSFHHLTSQEPRS